MRVARSGPRAHGGNGRRGRVGLHGRGAHRGDEPDRPRRRVMRSVARRLTGQSYTASKQLALWRMRRTEPPLVVFSMGKTGSTAIARAIHDATGDPVFQVFRLQPDRLADAERRYRATGPRAPYPGARHLWESECLP